MSHTILIVDDHSAFRAAARAMLEADGFAVVGEAVDGESALAAIASLRPEVDGFTVAERLANQAGSVPAVVLISSRAVNSYRRRLSASPAVGFIAKSDLSGASLSALLAS
jgi:two-component system nitrate/nitrite response regulator NarL